MLITLQKNIITGFQKSHSHETALLCPLLYNAETFFAAIFNKVSHETALQNGKKMGLPTVYT